MAYSTIRYGSSGDDVKTLQQQLNSQGYKLDVDGQFGAKTQVAVKDYQKKSGLSVDGIVGKNTWGSLNSVKTPSNVTTPKTPAQVSSEAKDTASKVAEKTTRPTYTKSKETIAAEEALKKWESDKPNPYKSKHTDEINAMLDSILNGEPFSYDVNDDELYQIYKEQYEKNGKLAMQDTMAQAAALTGGYGSSYGTAAAQQAYQQYLSELNDVIPELQERAYGRYMDEKNDKKQNLALLQQQDEIDYGRYRDELGDYKDERAYLYQKSQDISDEEYQKFLQLVDEYEYDQAFAYQKERDKVADEQWQKSFDLSKSKSSGSSGGSSGSYSGGGKKPTLSMIRDIKDLAASGDEDAYNEELDSWRSAGYDTSKYEGLIDIKPTATKNTGSFMSHNYNKSKSEIEKEITDRYNQGLFTEGEAIYLYEWLDEKY